MGRARICRASCDWYVLARTGVQSVRLCHMGTDVSDGLEPDFRVVATTGSFRPKAEVRSIRFTAPKLPFSGGWFSTW